MFKITIEETREVEKTVGKEWKVVGQEYRAPQGDQAVDLYGYTPEIQKLVEVKRDILIQEVETINLAAVIKAINGL